MMGDDGGAQLSVKFSVLANFFSILVKDSIFLLLWFKKDQIFFG